METERWFEIEFRPNERCQWTTSTMSARYGTLEAAKARHQLIVVRSADSGEYRIVEKTLTTRVVEVPA